MHSVKSSSLKGRASGWFRRLPLLALAAVLALLLGHRAVTLFADPTGKASAEAMALDQQLIAAGKEGTEVLSNLTFLSDVIGPRLTGSANLKRANEWAAEKMKSYGLTNVKLEPWELPVAWERGTATARIVEPDNGKVLTVAAAGWSPGTKGKIIGDVVVINARSPEELKKYEGKLKGAIVLRGPPANVRPITDLSSPFDRAGGPGGGGGAGQPPQPPGKTETPAKPGGATPAPGTPPRGFDTRGGEFGRMRREINEFLKKEGAAVVLQDSSKPHGLLTMSGNWGGRDRATAGDPLPALYITHDHYALLHRLATRPEPAKTRVEVEITNTLIPGPMACYNTVGEIRGTEKPDEFVVLGAHIDSWDLGQGTTDNGTGTCVVLETARILYKCGVKPKRTIRFALFSGEEQGLHGSRAYVQTHKDEMPKTTAAIIHDTGTGKIIGLSLMGREVLKPIMEEELASLKALGVSDISTRTMGGSDHQSFEGGGVPGFMFRQDPAEYRLTHHSQSDTLDKAREPDLIQGAQVMAVIATRLANRPDMLPRDKPTTRTATPATEAKKTEEAKVEAKKEDPPKKP
jgi:hypothetical protein